MRRAGKGLPQAMAVPCADGTLRRVPSEALNDSRSQTVTSWLSFVKETSKSSNGGSTSSGELGCSVLV